ncbi:DUF5719 family protein [Streptomyces specialis]|uniref:DUF5719 family protein n=1 Tax=Streptomyces specialis TaxID=498367 RepID=UPI00073ED410|nr:DUF5719 family protein [Streptomyces specialis]
MNRAPLSLLAALAALVAVTGFASLGTDDTDTGRETSASESPRPVERRALTCPRPTAAESATTTYTAFPPAADGPAPEGDDGGSAALLPAPEHAPGTEEEPADEEDTAPQPEAAEPVVPLQEPGVPVAARVEEAGAPALTGTAEGPLAPGWTVQQTTTVPSGAGRGLLGTSCQTPDTEFWFAGASTADSRHDYVHITNPDQTATVVDIDLYGPDGRLESDAGQGITVPPGSTVPVRLSTLNDDPQTDLAVHVTARTGRIGALVEAVDETLGADWLPPSTGPAGRVVLPGIPADATSVRLVAFAPGDEDITLDVGLAGPGGTITPAGHETVSVHAGTLTAIDLGNLTQGDPGSLVLTPADGSGTGTVAAALRITTGEDDERETAFIAATTPVERRAVVSGNTVSGTELALAAPDEAAEVEVTYSAGTEGGEPVTETHTVEAGTTLVLTPALPDAAEGEFALTVRHTGGGSLYASRALTAEEDDMTMLTVQTLPDDRSTVAVPETRQDLSVLTD